MAPRVEVATAGPAPLSGRVDLASWGTRRAQALVIDVASKATVTLIDPESNDVVATTVADAQGGFQLNFSGSFTPNTQPYYLEAIKGLANNAVGHSAARLRTLARFNAGAWQSFTQGGILISRTTTALTAAASLKKAVVPPVNPPVDVTLLLDTVSPGSGPDPSINYDAVSAISFLSDCEYQSAWKVVRDALNRDLDPVAALIYDSTNTAPASCGFFRFTPGSAVTLSGPETIGPLFEGSVVTLQGVGFDSNQANDEVRFNGVVATIKSVSPTQLSVYVPQLTTAGTITVKVNGVIFPGPSFTIDTILSNAGKTQYLYTGPVGTSNDSVTVKWTENPVAVGYKISVGTTSGGNEIAQAMAGKVSSLTFATGKTLKGAWTDTTYFATIQPIIANVPGGLGSPVTQPFQIAEARTWDGVGTPDSFRTNDKVSSNPGGYSKDFPGAGVTQFWGHHYFETVAIAGTTYVTPFGYVDNILPGTSMADPRVGLAPKDGFLAIHANSIAVTGTIDASGRGYGAGPGISTRGGVFDGKGGAGGRSGDGGSAENLGNWNPGSAVGGQGSGGAGGGAQAWERGGNGGIRGGGGGGGDIGCGSGYNGPRDADNSTGAGGYGSGRPGNAESSRGGLPPWGGGQGSHDNTNSTSGGGGAGYGAGGGAATGDCSDQYDAGGGGGGTGGFTVPGTISVATGWVYALQRTGHSSRGLGWAPGVMIGNPAPGPGIGGPAGHYLPEPDTTTNTSFILGSGGAGGDHCNPWHCCWDGGTETSGGAGGGAGGGAIILDALQSLNVSGDLYAVGAFSGAGAGDDDSASVAGGGGGGSGGTIVLHAPSVTFTGRANALGGTAGGNGIPAVSGSGGNGGDGGVSVATGGTIKLKAANLSGAYTASALRVYVGSY